MTHHPRLLIVLLATASLCTMALLAFATLNMGRYRSDVPPPTLRTVADNPLFDNGLALPPFSLTDRSRKTVTDEQLKGKIWVANFIFTRCPGICPPLTQHMAKLQQELTRHERWPDIRLVSFTVEPEHDSPQRLNAFASQYGANPDHWLFLTGQRAAIWQLCRDGFKQPIEENVENPAIPIVHSSNFALVDRKLRIRGFYDGLDASARSKLLIDLKRILDE